MDRKDAFARPALPIAVDFGLGAFVAHGEEGAALAHLGSLSRAAIVGCRKRNEASSAVRRHVFNPKNGRQWRRQHNLFALFHIPGGHPFPSTAAVLDLGDLCHFGFLFPQQSRSSWGLIARFFQNARNLPHDDPI